jgi:hypothetical protein
MIAAIILACSLVFLLQFFVSYCRSLIASSAKHALSVEVQDVTGISAVASGDDFARVVQLLRLCPDRPEDRSEVRAIGAYFGLLTVARALSAKIAPAMQAWTNQERNQCTYFAAVILDRRIAFSRDLLARQMEA